MFSFFSKKANIASITIPVPIEDTIAWELEKNEPHLKLWVKPVRTVAISLNFFDQKPDIPPLTDISALRHHYRKHAVQAGGGIIEVNVDTLQGYRVVKTLLKIAQLPQGNAYLASLTFPFRDCSFVVKVQAMEVQDLGMRSTLVLDQMMETGKVKLTDQGLQGWTQDPYDLNFQEGKLMNLSEEAIFDAQFPMHPLTLARAHMAAIIADMRLGSELSKLATF